MKYFRIQLYYPGHKGETEECFKILSDAAVRADTLFNRADVNWRHAYAWPDGSLYYYVSSESGSELRKKLDVLFNDSNEHLNLISIEEIHESDASYEKVVLRFKEEGECEE